MANLDYPGPCPGCAGIDGCSTDVEKISAQNYCKGLEQELNTQKTRMHDTMVAFENSGSANQSQARENLNLLQSHIREIDSILQRLEQECPIDAVAVTGQDMGCVSPGWLGG